MLEGFAARASQLGLELREFQKTPGLALGANHETGVILYSLNTVTSKLIKLAGMVTN